MVLSQLLVINFKIQILCPLFFFIKILKNQNLTKEIDNMIAELTSKNTHSRSVVKHDESSVSYFTAKDLFDLFNLTESKISKENFTRLSPSLVWIAIEKEAFKPSGNITKCDPLTKESNIYIYIYRIVTFKIRNKFNL